MNDEQQLLVLTRKGEGIETIVNVLSDRDTFGVALSLFQLLTSDNPIATYFSFIAQNCMDDESFKTLLDEATVQIPDFNKILKEDGSK